MNREPGRLGFIVTVQKQGFFQYRIYWGNLLRVNLSQSHVYWDSSKTRNPSDLGLLGQSVNRKTAFHGLTGTIHKQVTRLTQVTGTVCKQRTCQSEFIMIVLKQRTCKSRVYWDSSLNVIKQH